MPTPILATKLYAPPSSASIVARPRLIERLSGGLDRKLTLISAPAGFGKTTLVGEWVAGRPRPAAWLSLDEGDNDPARFLEYFVAALQTIAAGMGAAILSMLESSQPPPTELLLTTLLNELATLPSDVVLVIDDYHAIESQPVDLALTFLLDHLPPQLHLVMATREDPQLPLARLRARGQLNELRAADLRFTPSEAAQFLNSTMGLRLAAADVAALEDRTEGWIAGLQLAALSLRGHQDVPGFLRAFAGDHRYIVDYLVEEVLRRQSEPVRNFLLQTAILDRLHGSLCDAVTGQKAGTARLVALERGNFFVVPLDDRRQWFRYHHLFADVLLAHLLAEQPDQVAILHRRASAWYGHNDLPSEAIHHALAAADFARAADLVELAVPAMRRSRQEATVLGWLKALPDEVVRCRPVLSVHYAGTLLLGGELAGVEARLRDAERWRDPMGDPNERPQDPPAGMVVVDDEEFRGLSGSIAMYRAAIALALGNLADTKRYAHRVLDLVPEDDHLRRGSAAGLLGLAYWTSGNLEAAHRSYADCMARLRQAGHLSDTFGCSIALADIQITQGRLREARHTYEHAVRLSTEPDAPVLRGSADMYVGLSELDRECGEAEAAEQHLMRCKKMGEMAGLPQNRHRWCVAMARLRQTQGDLAGALDLLDEAERCYVSDFFPNVRPIPALKTRVWIAQGRLGDALGWARERGLSASDDLSYLREFEHITLARVLLAQYRSEQVERSLREAIELLERLGHAADEGDRMGNVIEILVLQALAHQLQGDLPAALVPLERALTLAEPEGYARIFVDEGPTMATLLGEAAKRGIAVTCVRRLRKALDIVDDRALVKPVLLEPLSERERDVLRLLGTDLSGPDMARELVVSLNTLRTHTKNIYSKLGANTRRAAVRRAVELGLL